MCPREATLKHFYERTRQTELCVSLCRLGVVFLAITSVLFTHADVILKTPLLHTQHLVHESASMKAEGVEEHLLAEKVHLLNSHEQRGHTGSNNRAAQHHKKR